MKMYFTTYCVILENNIGTSIDDNVAVHNSKLPVDIHIIIMCCVHIGNNCVSLKDPDNGTVYQFPDGTTAIFSCKNGFITKGESILRCVNGNWSSSPPKCVQP